MTWATKTLSLAYDIHYLDYPLAQLKKFDRRTSLQYSRDFGFIPHLKKKNSAFVYSSGKEWRSPISKGLSNQLYKIFKNHFNIHELKEYLIR